MNELDTNSETPVRPFHSLSLSQFLLLLIISRTSLIISLSVPTHFFIGRTITRTTNERAKSSEETTDRSDEETREWVKRRDGVELPLGERCELVGGVSEMELRLLSLGMVSHPCLLIQAAWTSNVLEHIIETVRKIQEKNDGAILEIAAR